jgi:hypothetical protein
MEHVSINDLLNKFIISIERVNDDIIYFYLANGAEYKMYHAQDCCEHVSIEDIEGDLDDLIGTRILQSEVSTQDATTNEDGYDDSATWTFYKLATVKGYVTIRWFGSSNGYYSESADFAKIKEEDPIREQRRKKLLKLGKNE